MPYCHTRLLPMARRCCGLFLLSFAGLVAGCGSATDRGADDADETTSGGRPAGQVVPGAKHEGDGAVLRETWDVQFLEGKRVGFAYLMIREDGSGEKPRWRVTSRDELKIRRGADEVNVRSTWTSVESPEEGLLRFESLVELGGAPTRVVGRRERDEMLIEVTAAGPTNSARLAWPESAGGKHAVEQSLLNRPIRPGEERQVDAFDPVVNKTVEVTLHARDYETTKLLEGSFRLLHVDIETRFPDGTRLPGRLWVDASGEVLKTQSDLMRMRFEGYRTTEQIATAPYDGAAVDLLARTTVRLSRPIGEPYDVRRIRYRVRMEDGNPADIFPSDGRQQVRAVDAHTADVVITARRATDPPLPATEYSPPGVDALGPTPLVESDDPLIVNMAESAAAGQEDPLQLALALERYVNRKITRKNYSQIFASAVDVARRPEGDCTEHAVLLAALCRARELPARVAIGLVCPGNGREFAYHMWNEVYIDGRWIPLDAMFARGGTGSAHLKLADSTLAGVSAYATLLPVAQVAGQLQIEVIEVVP